MNDLEFLKDIFKDQRLHLAIGTVTSIGLSQDGSILRVIINILPEGRPVVAEMTFADVYDVTFPELKDLAFIGMADGEPDECFVLKLINNKQEPIPKFAQTGDAVKYARPGKKLYIGSDTKIGLARPNIEATNPLVLGDVLTNFLTNFTTRFVSLLTTVLSDIPTSVCAVAGVPDTINPALVTALNNLNTQMQSDITTYLQTSSSNIVSQISFTERGV